VELVQRRIVTDDVEGLAAFYAALVGASVTLNEYYVEVPAGSVTVGFSRRRFTEYQESQAARTGKPCRRSRRRKRTAGAAAWPDLPGQFVIEMLPELLTTVITCRDDELVGTLTEVAPKTA
jgi:hypothetical protein